jgi:hypothetical protein
VRDDQVPHEQLDAADESVELPDADDGDSSFRLILVVFPLTEGAAQMIQNLSFDPNSVLKLEWRGARATSKPQGH